MAEAITIGIIIRTVEVHIGMAITVRVAVEVAVEAWAEAGQAVVLPEVARTAGDQVHRAVREAVVVAAVPEADTAKTYPSLYDSRWSD